MVSRSKSKGDREERVVVELFRSMGIPAQRTLSSGARSDGSLTWDLDVYWKGEQNAPLIGECKVRGDGFKELYKWIGENDFLTVRADRKERLYVIPERLWIRFMEEMKCG
jgi:hypothetical protein